VKYSRICPKYNTEEPPFFELLEWGGQPGAEACTNSGIDFGTVGESRSAARINSPENSSPAATMLQIYLPELDHILGVKKETGEIRALPKKQD
jgi:hypothetical protein